MVSSSLQGEGAVAGGELKVGYAACEALVAVCAILGNGLVILVFAKERKLRRRTNYYIISLACADLLVGLFAIPFAVLASIGLPRNLHACLFTVSVLVVLCTISIFCLVAVSVDRYWAILHPMGYSRTVRTKTAIGIICVCWLAGTLVGFLPLLGWNAGHKSDGKCIFVEVMDYDYLVFLYFATIIFPALLIAAFYAHIYRVVIKQLQQIVTMNPGCRRKDDQTHGTMLRLLGAAQKREVKATQNLSRIVLFFIICWFPLYTINCVEAFCPQCQVNEVLLNFCIILSHLNSAGNPLLYAYHLKDFRAALKSFIHGLLFPATAAALPPTATSRPKSLLTTGGAKRQQSTTMSTRPLQPSLVLPTDHLALSDGSGSGMSSKPGSISIIAAADNGNNNNNFIKMNNNSSSSNRKRTLGLSSPVSILGCRSRRDADSSSSSSSSNSSDSSPNASPGQATRLGSNEAEAATCNTSASSVLPTLELKTYEFEAALQFVDCDDDDGGGGSDYDRTIISRQRSTLVIEADVNCSVVVAAASDELPSDKRNFDQVPGQ